MIDLILWFYIGYKLNILTWWYVTILIFKGLVWATKWSITMMDVGSKNV